MKVNLQIVGIFYNYDLELDGENQMLKVYL